MEPSSKPASGEHLGRTPAPIVVTEVPALVPGDTVRMLMREHCELSWWRDEVTAVVEEVSPLPCGGLQLRLAYLSGRPAGYWSEISYRTGGLWIEKVEKVTS